MRVRFDFVGRGKSNKLFRGKNCVELAEQIREHKVSLIRNVPMQGIEIEDIDVSQEVYTICDEITNNISAYAPITICLSADSLEDAVRFTMKEEFRRVEILDPESITLSKLEIERLLLKVSAELLSYKDYLKRKLDNWN
jgi:hypothetical protein